MSGTTPPPSQPPMQPPTQPPGPPAWEPGWTAAEPLPPYQPPATGRRGFKAMVLTAVLVLFVGGGAFAFYTLDPFNVFRAGPQASEALPANAIFYAGVDLDPKAGQKVDALRFLNHSRASTTTPA